MCNDFAHLHSHGEFSLIDGLGTWERTIKAVAEKGFKVQAITEHGTLAGAMGFQLLCEQYGIKPIQGMEGYITVDNQRGHITLLSDGVKGWQSLVNLNNIAQKRGGFRPTFTIDELLENNDGLVVLTGCMASPLQKIPDADAIKLGAKLKGIFGNRLYAEIMAVNNNPESIERSLKLAKDLNLKLIATNDTHFAYESDAVVHKVLTQLKADFAYQSGELYLKTSEELLDAYRPFYSLIEETTVIQAMQNAGELADMLTPVNLKSKPHLPKVKGIDDENAYLQYLVNNALVAKGLHTSKEYTDRAKYELSVIADMEFARYFLLLLEIIETAKGIGSRIGAGRGSGAGSLVLYLLGVTTINPLEWGLQFERFLNPNRKEFPDVDVDFDSCTRQKVLDEISTKYDGVQVATYSTYNHKSLTRDLGKYFNVPKTLVDAACEKGDESAEFKKIISLYPEFAQCYETIKDQTRHLGKHAGGFVMIDKSLPLPLQNVGGVLCAAYPEGFDRNLSAAGGVKFDILGVSALDALQRMETETGQKAPFPLPDNDPVFSLFQTGKLAGIFQFSGSEGIQKLVVDVQPNKVSDLIAINALYRPATLNAGTAQKFVEWRNKPRLIHPDIDSILAETYGIIAYQEQMMQIVALFTGGSLAYADDARKLFSKPKHGDTKWEKKIKEIEKEFRTKGEKLYGKNIINLMWHEIVEHSKYSFNKSHSTAYTAIACEMAWFKYHYPLHFYTAMLNTDIENVQTYLIEMAQEGIILKPPHVNISNYEYTHDDTAVYMPLNSVKFFGQKGAEIVYNERMNNGNFSSIAEFVSRCPKRDVNARAKRGLYAIGALSGLNGTYADLGIKGETDAPELEPIEAQREYLGYIIPTQKFVQSVAKMKDLGWTAGIVTSKDERNKGRGVYTVFKLLPSKVFWAKGKFENIPEGSIIKARVNEQNGMGYSIERVK